METWAGVASIVATVAFLAVSGTGYVMRRGDRARLWRASVIAAFVGTGALLVSVALRSVAAQERAVGWLPLTRASDRATVMALLAGGLRLLRRDRPAGWAGWIPVALVAGTGVTEQPDGAVSAPVLLLVTVAVAALGLWSAGQALDAAGGRAAALTFAGLTLNLALVGTVYGQVWGSAAGPNADFWALAAAWLVAAARFLLQNGSPRLTRPLDVVTAVMLGVFALGVRWRLPFS